MENNKELLKKLFGSNLHLSQCTTIFDELNHNVLL